MLTVSFLPGIVLTLIAAIVVVGMAVLMLWKLLTTIHDRREYAKWDSERKSAKWDTVSRQRDGGTEEMVVGRGGRVEQSAEWNDLAFRRTGRQPPQLGRIFPTVGVILLKLYCKWPVSETHADLPVNVRSSHLLICVIHTLLPKCTGILCQILGRPALEIKS